MLFGVKPVDFETYAAISAVLGAVALAASYLPSRRAMALDPLTALRHE
jgi:putative ABC transport system permease protein